MECDIYPSAPVLSTPDTHTTELRKAENHHLIKFYHNRHQMLLVDLETLRNGCSGVSMGLTFFLMPKMHLTIALSINQSINWFTYIAACEPH